MRAGDKDEKKAYVTPVDPLALWLWGTLSMKTYTPRPIEQIEGMAAKQKKNAHRHPAFLLTKDRCYCIGRSSEG